MAATIAVLITYHNEGPFLAECLDSLRSGSSGAAGSLPDEILVYDDASSLPPGDFIPAGLAVRVIRGEENVGPSRGRNALLAACQSQFVHFHDADDRFAEGWTGQVRAALEATGAEAVFTEIASFREGSWPVRDGQTDLSSLTPEADLVRHCLSNGMLVPAGTFLRERVLAVGGYSGTYWQSEDYDFHVRLAAAGLRFTVIRKPLVWIRLHSGSRSRDHFRVWLDSFRVLERLSSELAPRYHQDICNALGRTARNLYRNGGIAEGRAAFALARRFGHPQFPVEPLSYRLLVRLLGLGATERIGGLYRRIVPPTLRQRVRGPVAVV